MAERRRPPGRVADALRHVVQRIDPDRRLAVYRLWTFWADEVGPTVAARAEPASFRDGVLSVRVAGAAWMQELQFMKEDLRQRLNQRLGGEPIRDIYFVSGAVQRPAPPARTDPAPPEEPPVPLPPLKDHQLAAVFERLTRAARRRGRREGS